MSSSGGSSGPTAQQQQLEAQQALTTAQLNVQENEQRKAMLQSMQGNRVFRGSALSRAIAGNTEGNANAEPQGAPSKSQTNNYGQVITAVNPSLLDTITSKAQPGTPGSSTPAGGRGGGGGGSPGRGMAPGR